MQGKLVVAFRVTPRIICLLLSCFLISTVSSQDFRTPPKLQFSIEPGLGYKGGNIGEYVFTITSTGKSVDYAPSETKQLSYLQWDIYSLIFAELDFGLTYKAFQAQIHGEIGLPMKAGKMGDYDWGSTKGHQTHFSTHPTKLTSHLVAGGTVGWEFSSPNRQLQFIPLVGFSWQKTSMLAYDGYKQYVSDKLWETTPWTDDLEKEYFDGDVINYEHEVFQVDCIFRIIYNHNPQLYFNLEGSIHPVIAAFGYDTHILRNEQFLDYNMKGSMGFGAALAMGYQVLPKQWLTIKLHYDYLPVVTGQTYAKNTSQKSYHPSSGTKGGASHWFVGVTLGWKFNLFQ